MPFDIPELKALTDEQQELLLDIGQMILDVIGIFEPTPFADSTSAIISIYRGQWVNAGLSGLSLVPYLGDAAKFGKFSKYLETVNKAIAAASKDSRFEKILRPVFEKLYSALDRIPLSIVPEGARHSLEKLREKVVQFLPGVVKTNARLEKLTDEMLRLIFGSSKNVGRLPRENVRTIVQFFERHNVAHGNLDKWRELIQGIDLHALKPVSVEKFQRGDIVVQYAQKVKPKIGAEAEYMIGQWMVKVQGAPAATQLGLSSEGRARVLYRVRREVEVLKSKAAAAADHWTEAGLKPHSAIVREKVNGQYVYSMEKALQVGGGGEQYFMPQAWLFLDKVP